VRNILDRTARPLGPSSGAFSTAMDWSTRWER
jgi:hypothetical protein